MRQLRRNRPLRPPRVRVPRKRIWVYKRGSQGAKSLAIALGIKVLKHEGSTFVARQTDTIINWGDSNLPARLMVGGVVNRNLGTCTNKLIFFRAMSAAGDRAPRCPGFGTTREWANERLAAGRSVCARTILTGHSGQGIIIVHPGEEIPYAPLYTEYVPKESEYRVHIVRGEIIDIQRKIRDPNRVPTNWHVRNHSNGFIFVRGGFDTPEDVKEQARRSFSVSGLDFGAVDVLWNRKRNQAYVLEINTAPGLVGTTVSNYASIFRRIIG